MIMKVEIIKSIGSNLILFIVTYFLSHTLVFPSDFDMKKELAKLALLDTFPDNPGFYNVQGIKYYKKKMKNVRNESELYFNHFDLAYQYLCSGYIDSALMHYNMVPDAMWNNAFRSNPHKFDKYMYLALCHMRDGEQINCEEGHNEYSCILPLAEKALHIDQNGSRKAISYYKRSLDRFPDNHKAKWLMNIAYMTVGEYPGGVPKKYFIDFEKFPQYEKLPYFLNVGTRLGVDAHTFYGGSITEDFNNDGFQDIFATSTDLETNVSYYVADRRGGFVDQTNKAGLSGITGGSHCLQADYDNDGYIDIYIVRGGWLRKEAGKKHPNSLLKNNGDGTFSDVTHETGLLEYYSSHTACWGDYNNDGWVDLFVGNENGVSQLFENKNGYFTDVSRSSRMYVNGLVKGSFWGDYNNDGNLDIFISISGDKNLLMTNNGKNSNGQFTFSNSAQYAGVTGPINSFPCFLFDFNNDTYLDIFVSSYPMSIQSLSQQYVEQIKNIEYSSLYLNNGDGTFRDVAKKANLDRSIEAMGLNFGDVDNDGWLDFYAGTGFPSLDAIIPNLLFRNSEGKKFEEVSNAGFGHLQKGHGISFSDLDNDGDQDIYHSLGGFVKADAFWNMLLENPGNENNWITLELEGVVSNRSAIGTSITISIEDKNRLRKIHRIVGTGGSYGSSSLQQEIGIGSSNNIKSIQIFWPSTGKMQEFTNVLSNNFYHIREDSNEIKLVKKQKVSFSEFQNKHEINHHHHH